MKTKIISSKVSFGTQSVQFEEIFKLDDFKLKIHIKSDSIDYQSFATIDVWSNLEWKRLHSVKSSNMKTPHELKHFPQNQGSKKTEEEVYLNNKQYFQEDKKELIRVAKEVLA